MDDRTAGTVPLWKRRMTADHTFTNDKARVRETERILDDLRAYEHLPADIYRALA